MEILPLEKSKDTKLFTPSCSNLKTINIPESVTFIGSYPLRNCNSLSEIYYNSAYSNTSILADCGSNVNTTLYFGENLSDIPYVLYTNTNSSSAGGSFIYINHIVVKGNVSTVPPGVFASYNRDDKYGVAYRLKSVELPNSVTNIRSYAFSNCAYLDLIVPDTVTTIGSDAFYKVPHITYHGSATGSPWGALSIN